MTNCSLDNLSNELKQKKVYNNSRKEVFVN